MEKVFVYETLQKRKIDTEALGHPLYKYETMQDCILQGYKEVNKGNGYHTIIKKDNSEVKGKILSVTPNDLKKLDDWEDKYKRIKVTLKNGEEAWAYQLKAHKVVESYLKSTL
jgi:gamma-glutamylcyclotransferase (GGCT)/AIG2-like uncharacterized protein YtfP